MTETAQGKGRPAPAIAGGIVGVVAVALLALYVERGAIGAAAAKAEPAAAMTTDMAIPPNIDRRRLVRL